MYNGKKAGFYIPTGGQKQRLDQNQEEGNFRPSCRGYIPGHGRREPFFGGLLLGAYDTDRLIFTGKVGSGFSMQELQEISGEFVPSDESPFFNPISIRDVRWLKPELVVEVEALEVSKRKHLRAPVFLRKRTDKLPEECTIDQSQTT
jgi:ATP-dependent DNA ligase